MEEPVGGQTAVAAHRYGPLAGPPQGRRVGAAQVDDELVIEVFFDNPANVVFSENLRIHKLSRPRGRLRPLRSSIHLLIKESLNR